MERNICEINDDVIRFGPLHGQVDCVTGYSVIAVFIMLHIFSEKMFTRKKKNTLAFWAKKYVPDRFHHQSRRRFKAMDRPSRDDALLRSQG